METRDVSNVVVAILLVAAIVALVALAQGTPDHARDRGHAPGAAVTAVTLIRS
jgi:hypothetical protein